MNKKIKTVFNVPCPLKGYEWVVGSVRKTDPFIASGKLTRFRSGKSCWDTSTEGPRVWQLGERGQKTFEVWGYVRKLKSRPTPSK